ncbi:hypothetical protein PHIM7_65 [Sinorhizobium phage phiM7]|uniref:Uncharacterized protein n=3 Tax=Emdodecavirus TaxID=1980937 RepID=S5MAS2_9CAUD|nr:hypothetical protein AB690_gp071 [Sinorhizobium phage phiM12]YP_009212321.1 hypothetical protein AVT40_gp081 [Sinorhizobium phage phiN3]YP_009601190.1 hypothetical protein FDH46_gp065 [Sinorhizobium phage phiM7]AKF12973.1 hypothetical protein PHIM19_66 [Sinorhizobium phage phiM19]AGR47718.1 hypothetical protein SmphiM12_086 [Sinorhizobium phage phiM12]AKF12613.1 hypothetical protein PHIM7_65 [Sinorhizobium phage phiM7]AKF13345.1 hypothetical protein PHIN3_81 [Sinorhizobium phage phiN3]
MTKTKATLIFKGGMGNIVVKHVWLVEHGRRKYAQYNSAPFVRFIEKGKRTIRGVIDGYRPYYVILAGWQDIQTQSLYGAPVRQANGTLVSEGRYAAFDSGWQRDFEAGVGEFKDVIADYRDVNTMLTVEALAA